MCSRISCVLICSSLRTHDAEHLLCLFAVCIVSSLARYLFRFFFLFFNKVVFYCWVLRALCVLWVTVTYHICLSQIFYSQAVACLLILLIKTFKMIIYFFIKTICSSEKCMTREVSDKLLNDWKESFSLFDMIKLPNVVKNNTKQNKIKTNKQKL